MLRREMLFVDRTEPALVPERNINLLVDSHGSTMFGRLLQPAILREGERLPVALILHGYPGNERNIDIPIALRRAGMPAAFFAYRGVWGSHGDYSFSHLLEDVFVMLAHLRENAEEYGIDPERMFLVGHSMGGFATLNAIAAGAAVRGAVILAPCDLAYQYQENRAGFDRLMQTSRKGFFTLRHEGVLEEDVAAHAKDWRFTALVDRLPPEIPLHFVGAAQDALVPPEQHIRPLYELLRQQEREVSYVDLQDSHDFPINRIALTQLIFDKLAAMAGETAQ